MSEEQAKASDVVDALLAATKHAAALIESLDRKNHIMSSAAIGVLPDGTPVDDILAELKDTRAHAAALDHTIIKIAYQARRPSTERADAIKQIRELTNAKRRRA